MSTEEGKTPISRPLLIISYETSTFILLRYPFLCAVLLMVATAEEISNKAIASDHVTFLYFHLGLFVICGTIMAFDIFGGKRVFAIITALQFMILTYQDYQKSYCEQILFRVISRNLAVIGSFLSVAGGIAKKKLDGDRNKIFLIMGRQIIGTYALLMAMLIWNSPEEYKVYSNSLAGSHAAIWFILGALIVCAISIYSGYEVVIFCKAFAMILIILTMIVDLNFSYWNEQANIKHWVTATIAAKHLPVINALLLMRKGYL